MFMTSPAATSSAENASSPTRTQTLSFYVTHAEMEESLCPISRTNGSKLSSRIMAQSANLKFRKYPLRKASQKSQVVLTFPKKAMKTSEIQTLANSEWIPVSLRMTPIKAITQAAPLPQTIIKSAKSSFQATVTTI